MATLPDRKAVREYIAAQLSTALTAAQSVYDYQPGATTMDGKSPVVTVSSAGTEQRFDSDSYNPATMVFSIAILVKHSDPGGAYGPATSEDVLDNLEQDVRQWIRNNAGTTSSGGTKLWDNLRPAGPSVADYVNILGVWYRRETIQVAAYVGALA